MKAINLNNIEDSKNISIEEKQNNKLVNSIIDYKHDGKVVKEMLSQSNVIGRYKKFCKAFDLNVGDIIYIYGWGFFYIGETCFYILDKQQGKKKDCKYPPYDLIINRGYFKLNKLVKVKMNMNKDIKTYKNWLESDYECLEGYLVPGDKVDMEMYEHFLNVLPPLVNNSHLLQISEPSDYVNGGNTYTTFEYVDGCWIYRGDCHKGSTINYKIKTTKDA